jgi:hypothetical protein
MERWIAWRSPATILGGACVAGAVLCAQPAHAGEPTWGGGYVEWGRTPDAPSEEEDAPYDRELAWSGSIMTGFAVGTLVGAGVTFGVAEAGKEYCGLTGCFRSPDPNARLAAASMLVGGGAMAIISVPVWLAGANSKPWARRSNRRMVSGIVLTTVGTGACAVSALLLAASIDPSFIEGPRQTLPTQALDRLDFTFIAVVVQGLAGVAMVSTGIPLWAAGARDPEKEDHPPWMYPELRVSLGGASLETRF